MKNIISQIGLSRMTLGILSISFLQNCSYPFNNITTIVEDIGNNQTSHDQNTAPNTVIYKGNYQVIFDQKKTINCGQP